MSHGVEELARRLAAVEDRLAILTLLAGSAYSSDVASEEYWTEMFAEEAVLDRGAGRPTDQGRSEILKIVNGADQRHAIAYGMAHLSALPHITINGDTAVATGYLLVVVPDKDASKVELPGKGTSPGLSIYQLTVNRWELARHGSGWVVTKRVVRPLASDETSQILLSGIGVSAR